MEYKLSLSIELMIIEFFVWLLIKKIFKLRIGVGYLLLTQTLNVAVVLCFIFSGINIIYLLLIKYATSILICLLTTNEYKCKIIFGMFGSYFVLSLAIFGYYHFLYLVLINLNADILIVSSYFNIIFALAFIMFYLLLYFLAAFIKTKSNFKNFLADVSFSLSGKHISLKGLIDSGNSVYDSNSRLPVVLLSIDSLKKFMPLASFSYVSEVLSSHLEKCVLVGGNNIYVPIVKVEDCKIFRNGKANNARFVVGVVEQKFYDEKHYDCLLHRDFV